MLQEQTREEKLRVYKKAIRIIKTKSCKKYALSSNFLCFLLPCILWDLRDYLSDGPNNMTWCYTDASVLFPELNEWLDVYRDYKETDIDDGRLKFLKKWVAELKK